MVVNLVDNAIRPIAFGSAHLRLKQSPSATAWKLAVVDNGPGISSARSRENVLRPVLSGWESPARTTEGKRARFEPCGRPIGETPSREVEAWAIMRQGWRVAVAVFPPRA